MSRIHRTAFLVASIALGGATTSYAGVSGLVIEQLQQKSASSAPSPSYSSGASSSSSSSYSVPSAAPSYSPPPAPRVDPRVSTQSTRSQSSSSARQPAAPSVKPNQSRPRGSSTPNETAPTYTPPGNAGGVLGGALSRNFRDRTPGNGGGNGGGGNGGGNGGGGGHGGHHPHPPHVVYTLPPYYRDYWWDGYPYYTFGGGWYRPFGGSGYIAVDAPYGLFVSSLPGHSTSFWYGNTRYYYNDDTYYTYDSGRRGYVVAQSPYDDEEYHEEGAQPDLDMYIYPSNGQSEQQQADDRYACHKWAAKEAGYDPIDDDYDRNKRADYTRAMTACLNGRGYSVR